MTYLSKAIWKLRPTAQFSFRDEDYSTVKWDVLEGDAPSEAEISAAIQQVKLEEAQAEAEAAAKRSAALAKLAALGLDEDDLKALGF